MERPAHVTSTPRSRPPGDRRGRSAGGESFAGAPCFIDRRQAGRALAALLADRAGERTVVLGMPRGGVPVAAEVAAALSAPLDVALVRKVGAPSNPEFAIGAVGEQGAEVISAAAVRALGLSAGEVRVLVARAERELRGLAERYRGRRAALDLHGSTAVLVDDGLATGSSAHAALLSLHRRGASRVVLALPVAARQSLAPLRALADEIVCVALPAELGAVGIWYQDFAATTDEEVASLLAAAPPARTAIDA